MTSLFFVTLFVLLMGVSIFLTNKAFKRGKSARKLILGHILSFLMIVTVCSISATFYASAQADSESTVAEASQSQQQTTEAKSSSDKGWGYIAMALAIGFGCIGAGVAVAAAAPAAIGATSEDPSSFGKSLIFVALAEGVSIFGFLVSIFIYGAIS